jgi:thiamine biosynthesis lipoprotein
MPSTRRLRVALGTWVAIETRADNPLMEQAAIEAAYACIGEVERWMHPHREGSDLTHIKSAALHAPIEVRSDTWHVLQLARRLHALTDGVFDPCLPHCAGRLQDVEISRSEPVLICHAPVEIDLGGIAKGHAIDRAVEKLKEHGCHAGLVNAGGDLRVFGDRNEAILLRHAAADGNYRQLDLRNAALAVSDTDATERPVEHQGYYTHTGQQPTHRYAAVSAATAATADALTKCVLLCPPQIAARALKELEAHCVASLGAS